MKYIAVLNTDDYKDFEFFEDGIGKYMVAKDAGVAADGEWMPLYFTEYKQEPCEDVISREDVLAAISRIGLHKSDTKEVQAVAECLRAVEDLMPAALQSKIGHWIEDEYEMKVWCSECGEENDCCSKYCPYCGAKMVEPQESEG